MRLAFAPGFALSVSLVGCDTVDWEEKLQSQVAMPRCAGTQVVRTESQSNGQDYSNTIDVTASLECLASWQAALMRSTDYHCEGTPVACARYDERRRFDEEWATIVFVGNNHAKVELTKI